MRILIIDGHPDPRPHRFLHALARAYREGAEAAGHEVETVAVGAIDFPLLRTAEDFRRGTPPPVIEEVQQKIAWADHLLILFPLWLGAMPAVLKALLEQTLRPGFAFAEAKKGRLPKKLLRGKTSRVVVTMGMPGFFYRFYLRAHSLKSLERNVLAFCGIKPVGSNVIGMIEGMGARHRAVWLARMAALGRRAR
jgi:putative NADPH-quinone reductase